MERDPSPQPESAAGSPPRANYDDLDFDDELALLDGRPFSGIVYSLRPDGTLESESRYVDGLPDGLEEEWYPDGRLASRVIAIRGNGASEARTWHRNGAPRSVRHYVDRRLVSAQAWDEAGRPVDPATLPLDNAFGTAVPGQDAG